MTLDQTIQDIVLSADAKVLGTHSAETGVHLAPVSTIKIIDDSIIMLNYFMTTTAKNVIVNNKVSLVCFKNFEGIQIKGTVDYQTEGALFNDMTLWTKEAFPDRTISGVFVLHPEEIFDVSAQKEKKLYTLFS